MNNQYEIDKLLHQYKYGVITLKMLIESMMQLQYFDHDITLVCEYLATALNSWGTRVDFYLPLNMSAEDLIFFWENN